MEDLEVFFRFPTRIPSISIKVHPPRSLTLSTWGRQTATALMYSRKDGSGRRVITFSRSFPSGRWVNYCMAEMVEEVSASWCFFPTHLKNMISSNWWIISPIFGVKITNILKPPASYDYMAVSKNSGFSPQIIHFNRVFHYFHHPFWGTSATNLLFSPVPFKKVGPGPGWFFSTVRFRCLKKPPTWRTATNQVPTKIGLTKLQKQPTKIHPGRWTAGTYKSPI